MRFESFSALRGCLKNSPWFSSDKTFVAYDISQFFQGTGIAGIIAVGHRDLLFLTIEISLLIYHQNSHDAQSDLAFECFINILECFYHL